jgi:hypothetical protein
MEHDRPLLDASGNPIRRKEDPTAHVKRVAGKRKALAIALGAAVAFTAGVVTNFEKILRFVTGEDKPKAVLETTEILVDPYRKDYTALLDFRGLLATFGETFRSLNAPLTTYIVGR